MRYYSFPRGYEAYTKGLIQVFSKRCYHRDDLQEKNWQVGPERAFYNLMSRRKSEGR